MSRKLNYKNQYADVQQFWKVAVENSIQKFYSLKNIISHLRPPHSPPPSNSMGHVKAVAAILLLDRTIPSYHTSLMLHTSVPYTHFFGFT
jgi:hypothetical protein